MNKIGGINMLRTIRGDKKDTCQFGLVLAKIFRYSFVHQKENSQKPLAKVKKTREEM